ncbi:hypothetical protein Ptr902_04391 [Pyrenophora tritici-repentis]|nr:hypothetical protein A1F99_074620 [Pyrenophora tritici-repentis]KAI0569779.1 hypothetical protein Alg130_11502 [Pyrenophora tritici-repentis]KAI0570223.1 hypothetical protein Alg130_11310 [Pyrenophora tritici-repentis]KAI0604452.1 hypothetical protein TUN205_11299 [Pyrenophora tritici-repentis]KAI0616699.1 hypothetical protein TUN199_11311 [Pyrenophora tritici-repentis]
MKCATISTAFLLLLASEQGLAQDPKKDSVNVCCGIPTPGPVGQTAGWCQGLGGNMLCVNITKKFVLIRANDTQCNYYTDPTYRCIDPFGAPRKTVPGGASYEYVLGNDCRNGDLDPPDNELSGWRMCVKDGSSW